MGFVVDKATLGHVSFYYLCFPRQSFHRLLHTHLHPSSGAGTKGHMVADVTIGLTLSLPKKLNEYRLSYGAV
jgi:hypothetical protein